MNIELSKNIRKNLYDIGEKKDFIFKKTVMDLQFKAIIKGICDYDFAIREKSIAETWLLPYSIAGISEDMLQNEPFYICRLLTPFGTYKRNDEIIFPQIFLNEDLTKDSEDEFFSVYAEINLQSNHKDFEVKADVVDYINKILKEKGLAHMVRLLKQYDERDIKTITRSLKLFLDVNPDEPDIRKSIINLLTGATKYEIVENQFHNKRYQLNISDEDNRKIKSIRLSKYNKKIIFFKF